jgi:putative flippase GtrA
MVMVPADIRTADQHLTTAQRGGMMPKLDTAGCPARSRHGGPVPSRPSPRQAGAAEGRPGRSAFGSFARFVLLGGGVGLASSIAVPVVATLIPWAAANALITVASTLLGTELHARFTFGAGRRAGWHQHLQSAGSATAAYLVTSAAILLLHAVQPSAGIRWEQAVYLSASGLAGAGRFLVLRRYVFARNARPAPASAACGGGMPAPHRAVVHPAGGYLPLATSDRRRTERRRHEEVTASARSPRRTHPAAGARPERRLTRPAGVPSGGNARPPARARRTAG